MTKLKKAFLAAATSTAAGIGTGYIIGRITDDGLLSLGSGCAAAAVTGALVSGLIEEKPVSPIPTTPVTTGQKKEAVTENVKTEDVGFSVKLNYNEDYIPVRDSIVKFSLTALTKAVDMFNKSQNPGTYKDVYFARLDMSACLSLTGYDGNHDKLIERYMDASRSMIDSDGNLKRTIDRYTENERLTVTSTANELLQLCRATNAASVGVAFKALKDIYCGMNDLKSLTYSCEDRLSESNILMIEYAYQMGWCSLRNLYTSLDGELKLDISQDMSNVFAKYIDEDNLDDMKDAIIWTHSNVMKCIPLMMDQYYTAAIEITKNVSDAVQDAETYEAFMKGFSEELKSLTPIMEKIELLHRVFTAGDVLWPASYMDWASYAANVTGQDIEILLNSIKTTMTVAQSLPRGGQAKKENKK